MQFCVEWGHSLSFFAFAFTITQSTTFMQKEFTESKTNSYNIYIFISPEMVASKRNITIQKIHNNQKQKQKKKQTNNMHHRLFPWYSIVSSKCSKLHSSRLHALPSLQSVFPRHHWLAACLTSDKCAWPSLCHWFVECTRTTVIICFLHKQWVMKFVSLLTTYRRN